MNDMSFAITPKSDQINADDLQQTGPRTITISKVNIKPGAEQPVSMIIEGDTKVFRPCKSMSRAIVAVWGKDASLYTGRSLTVYCDPDVTYGPLKVGGIRISHMSHIDSARTIVLTATRGNKKPYTVRPLVQQGKPATEQSSVPASATTSEADAAKDYARDLILRIRATQTEADLHAIAGDATVSADRAKLAEARPKLEAQIAAAFSEAFARLAPPSDDMEGGDGGSDFPGDDVFREQQAATAGAAS